jgi:hypothetical protein
VNTGIAVVGVLIIVGIAVGAVVHYLLNHRHVQHVPVIDRRPIWDQMVDSTPLPKRESDWEMDEFAWPGDKPGPMEH